MDLPDTSEWRRWDVPWPSPHVGPLQLMLPRGFSLPPDAEDHEEIAAEAEAQLMSRDRALGIWFALPVSPKVDPFRGPKSWAMHISPRAQYPSAGISPPPALLDERECTVLSHGRTWNVITFVTEGGGWGTAYWFGAYSIIGPGVTLSANGHGPQADFQGEALAILLSVTAP